METTLDLTYDIPLPPAEVWPMLTEPEHLATWLGPHDAPADAPLQEGDQLRVQPVQGPDPDFRITVLHLDAPHEALWMWEPIGTPPQLVTITCLPLPNGGSRVAIRHSGIPANQPQACASQRSLWQSVAITWSSTCLSRAHVR